MAGAAVTMQAHMASVLDVLRAGMPETPPDMLLMSTRTARRVESISLPSFIADTRHPLPLSYLGLRIVASPAIPDEMPAIQMSPDCDPQGLWCTPELRAKTNARLLEMFGTRPVVFIINREQGLAFSRALMERVDRDIERAFMGELP